jgi:hypothetical protein
MQNLVTDAKRQVIGTAARAVSDGGVLTNDLGRWVYLVGLASDVRLCNAMQGI